MLVRCACKNVISVKLSVCPQLQSYSRHECLWQHTGHVLLGKMHQLNGCISPESVRSWVLLSLLLYCCDMWRFPLIAVIHHALLTADAMQLLTSGFTEALEPLPSYGLGFSSTGSLPASQASASDLDYGLSTGKSGHGKLKSVQRERRVLETDTH